ncbi:MAG: hypothetical protein QOH52_2515 [Pseudonocardiales bacterium]|nr:hypothetical protein [Pseudonocardiales bacterium]
MAGRWRDPAAFRADPTAAPAMRPSPRQSIALLAVLILAAGAIAAASYLIRPDKARSFDLFHGSVVLGDSLAPVAVDLASGKPTVRLIEANAQVGAKNANDLAVVPLQDGTLLLNSKTGEFNMVDSTGFVIKHSGGVPLPARAGSTGATGIPSGEFAYIEQTGPTGTSIYLVGPTTVQSAAIANSKVKPRAFRSMAQPGSTAPGAAASANGDLWLLVGPAGQQTIRQLSLPSGSSAGATLASADHGTVGGPAAIGSATAGTDGSGPSVVGVASANQIQLFRNGTSVSTVRYPAPAGIDSILPASNAQGRLSYLMHGANGWSVVSVDVSGTGLRGPTPLTSLATGAQLVAPAASRGSLYTMDAQSGQTVRIDGSDKAIGITGAADYPLATQNGRVIEPGGFADAYAIARGSRVIFNSPNHLMALVLFTDGSSEPLDIEKSSAVAVSAAGGAEALTRSRVGNPTNKPPSSGKTPPPQVSPVNNKINCKTATQKPHIPTLLQPIPGSRSVLLQWSYPLLDPSDCEPSTYVVKVSLLSNVAPSPPASVTVQGQKSVNLSGLFPSTQYEVTVTAYINGQGTESGPIRVTTGAEGPAAPKDVRAVTDSAGNWNVTWSACGSVARGCVPASSWKVIPEFCDGRGLSGAPAPLSVTADPTSVQQPPAQLQGGDALLGRGVRFQVEGIGDRGNVGPPSASTPCTISWSPPAAAAMTLAASQPATTSLGGSSATTVSLDLGSNPVRTIGGVGAKVTFRLTGPDGFNATHGPITYNGSGSSLSAKFDGVQAGAQYNATATVSPPGHPTSSVSLGPVQVVTSAAWPDLSLTGDCVPTGGLVQLTCDLTLHIGGVASKDARGETFAVIDTATTSSQFRCGGGPAQPLNRASIDPASDSITVNNLPLLNYHGLCTATVVLRENGAAPLVFGGIPSPPVSKSITVGEPSTYNAKQTDFSAQWDKTAPGSQVLVKYEGTTYNDNELGQLTDSWQETITAPNGTACGNSTTQPTSAGINIAADPQCVAKYGNVDGWHVDISYGDAGTSTRHVLSPYVLTGAPPSYQPCTPTGFQASWNANPSTGATVTGGGDPTALAGCSSFKYVLQDQAGNACGAPDTAPNPPAASIIPISCQTQPADGWTVHITWTDTAGNPQANPDIPLGQPPS